MSKSKTKQPKRVKGWLATWPDDTDGGLRATRSDAEFDVTIGDAESARVARMVEVRPGEVVVDVEKVLEEMRRKGLFSFTRPIDEVRAVLRNVGVR